ncbi:MAG: glycosyltransferase [Bacteroidota bacterium]|nr:glycosyltransferase [Bacteroidota bacterium]
MQGITIVTICFNNLADLQKTCASIDAQTRLPDEHWIINGSVTNDIAEWLANTPQPGYRKWLNERDQGISDAFNKGIERATQPITHLLHAGDRYASPQVLEKVAVFFSEHPEYQWISGNIQMIRGGSTVIVGKPFEPGKLYRGMRSVSHPTWFVKKEVYKRAGGFNGAYKIGMDYDLMCRIALEPYGYLNEVIAVFDDSGISSTQYLKALAESKKIYTSYFGFSLKLILWQFRLKILHYLLQSPIGKGLYHLKKSMGLENW